MFVEHLAFLLSCTMDLLAQSHVHVYIYAYVCLCHSWYLVSAYYVLAYVNQLM